MTELHTQVNRGERALSAAEGSDDAEIVARILAGELQLFELLMRRHNQRLFRAARAIVKSDDEAEDVMQEAYVRAYRHLSQFAGRAKLSTWLTRIAVHEALARVQKQRRQADLRSSALGRASTPEESEMSCDQASPEDDAVSHELGAILEPMVDALPDAFRVVFTLRAVEGLSVEETAECLELVPETVRTRFFRARQLLRRALLARGDIAEKGIYEFHRERCDRVVARVLGRVDPS